MQRRLPFLLLLLIASGAVAEGFRDPMRPAGVAPASAKPASSYSLKLEGVFSTTRVAIINGRLVRAGDSIGGARILEVSASGVRYERAGKIFTLTLPVVRSNATVRVARTPEENRP